MASQAGWLGVASSAVAAAAAAGAAMAWKRQPQTQADGNAPAAAQPSTDTQDRQDSSRAPSPAGAGKGTVSPMVSEVVPVWSRQLETTRSTADTGLGCVLNTFVAMNSSLDTLLNSLDGMSSNAQPGAVDAAIGQASAPLSCLLKPSQRAFEERDRAMGELNHCSQTLVELSHLARQAQEIGRHTRLVAFNASIEASRNQQHTDGGNEAVAHEMRLLATRMSESGAAIHRLVSTLQERIDPLRHAAVAHQANDNELRMELDLRAREALQALMAAVGASLSTSGSVKDSSLALRSHLDEAFVHFQFGDRISQMLAIISNDMNNFVEWTGKHPNATVDDANEWLKRLEASYTMEEQRSEHHGNVHVDRGSEVEFF
jgi:methyl-accepting chemotaxis protein